MVDATFQVVEDGYEFFAKRQLVTLFSAPNYCGEFDNAGAMMSVDETLMCSFQVRMRNYSEHAHEYHQSRTVLCQFLLILARFNSTDSQTCRQEAFLR